MKMLSRLDHRSVVLENLKAVNKSVYILNCILILYLLLYPALPELRYTLSKGVVNRPVSAVGPDEVASYLEGESDGSGQGDESGISIPLVYIPKIGVESEILEGEAEETLMKGIWRRPNSSTPSLGGNTVLAAHRFLYSSGAKTFYHLDKLEKGDEVYVRWENRLYIYRVASKFDVMPSDIYIEAPTSKSVLTLFTCTPLWNPTKRLVVRAELMNVVIE